MQHDKKLEKTWRETATKASKEPDADKVAELSQELIRALDEDTKEKLEHVAKAKQKGQRKSA